MPESTLKKITRVFTGAVIPPFQRQSFLRLIVPEKIGDEGVITWAKRILKKLALPKMQAAGGDWAAAEEKFDLTSLELIPYDVQQRVSMNRTEEKIFMKSGALPIGIDEMGSKMAQKTNNLFFLGKDVSLGDQYNKTNNQYVTKDSTGSTDFADPGIITTITDSVWDVAGAAQNDAANLVGKLASKGYNPATSILIYPEVTEPIFRRSRINATDHFGEGSILDVFLEQGILGAISVKDSLLYTDAGATPTVEAFDIYLVDFAELVAGYTIEENAEAIRDLVAKKVFLDAQVAFTPLFIPREFDDGFIYKGVSRITAIDANT